MKITQLSFKCEDCGQPLMINTVSVISGEDDHTYVEVGCMCLPCQSDEVVYSYLSLEDMVLMANEPPKEKNPIGFRLNEKPEAEA